MSERWKKIVKSKPQFRFQKRGGWEVDLKGIQKAATLLTNVNAKFIKVEREELK